MSLQLNLKFKLESRVYKDVRNHKILYEIYFQ